MAKKDQFLKSGLDGLFGDKSAKESKPETKKAQDTKESPAQRETKFVKVCTLVADDKMEKLRIIAATSGLSIKDVLDAAIGKALDTYEKKNGPIVLPEIKNNVKGKLFS